MVRETNQTKKIIELVIYSLVTVFGCLALYLFYKSAGKRKEHEKTQSIYLTNVIIVEVLIALFLVVRSMLYFSQWGEDVEPFISFHEWFSLSFVHFFLYISITIDRFLAVYLAIKYYQVSTPKRAKYVSSICWLAGILLGIVLYVVLRNKPILERYRVAFTIWPGCDVLFVIMIICVYTYICRKIFQNRRQVRHTTIDKQLTNNKKGILIPSMIIISFVLFLTIPDMIFFFFNESGLSMSRMWAMALNIIYAFAYISNITIILLIYRPNREALLGMLKKKDCRKKSVSFTSNV